jgi:restriction system protein
LSGVTPREYEALVATALRTEGYDTQLGPYHRDLGVDVFAYRGSEKLAVQAKMYAGARRQVNHECILQLQGAAAYFDCTGAVLATDSTLTSEARRVAEKLNVRVMILNADGDREGIKPMRPALDFDTIWQSYVMPLAGRTLTRDSGATNTVASVDWSGLKRITSSGKSQFIKIEIFRSAIEDILRTGAITREEINQRYTGRASSGITLILAEVPLFDVGGRPQTVRLKSR